MEERYLLEIIKESEPKITELTADTANDFFINFRSFLNKPLEWHNRNREINNPNSPSFTFIGLIKPTSINLYENILEIAYKGKRIFSDVIDIKFGNRINSEYRFDPLHGLYLKKTVKKDIKEDLLVYNSSI